MTRLAFSVLFSTLLLLSGAGVSLGGEADKVNLSVSVEWNAQGEPDLVFTMKSHSDQPLRFSDGFLPWSTWHSLTLVCVPASRGAAPLEDITPLDDPPLVITVLEPGAELMGRIALAKRFPSLLQTLATKDVHVFWAHDITLHGEHGTKPVAGTIRLKRVR